MMDDNLLYICPRAGECDSDKCDHREVHGLTIFCDGEVVELASGCPGCIPASIVVVAEEEPA